MTFMFKILNMHENIILLQSHFFMNGKENPIHRIFSSKYSKKHHQLNITSNISFHKIVLNMCICLFFQFYAHCYYYLQNIIWQLMTSWLIKDASHTCCFVYSFLFIFWNLELSNVLNVLFITPIEDLSCFFLHIHLNKFCWLLHMLSFSLLKSTLNKKLL
jgi:hypothetical protein